ncbi:MAG: putative selenate reductase subunit YgfK [bacterium]
MSHKMKPLSLYTLFNWINSEYQIHRSIFGIKEFNFFRSSNLPAFKIFENYIDTPFGPAAGPHTQLAQNIIASYLCGGRFIELKTVQIMDRLEIPKPCIDAQDEGYNVEWSQELKLEQSLEEYIKAYLLIHFIKNRFNLSNSTDDGFIFNMSVGYDLKGIQSERMDNFIEALKGNREKEMFARLQNELLELIESGDDKTYIRKKYLDALKNISKHISNSVTLSTMHGCPSNEIESITRYLIKEKGLNTFIKLNPTLLGYDTVKSILQKTGFSSIEVKEESFEKDLQFRDAINLINSLKIFAGLHNKFFGIKLSNTLGIVNHKKALAGDEMYMSGRALFPITTRLAYEVARELNGEINISFSGGANQLNARQIFECGIMPITFATDLLKPGGYNRLAQSCNSLDDIADTSIEKNIKIEKLKTLAESSLQTEYFKKESRKAKSIKISKSLPQFDCFIAPCKEACPIHQDVSEYIRLIDESKFVEALELIQDKNPLPHITGYICDHQCMFHCTRLDYDEAVKIRDLKLVATSKGFDQYLSMQNIFSIPNNGIRVAVIGAGPSGLSLAYFLSRAGFDVTVFEKNNRSGGIVQNVLPKFRLPQEAIDKDIKLLERYGIRFIFGVTNYFSVKNLRHEGFKYIYIAIGAEISSDLIIAGSNARIFNAIEFLRDFHDETGIKPGRVVAVIGGGNSAMDSARAAKRCNGVEKVFLIYRRTKEFMPADLEEFDAAIKDGVIFKELLSPVEFEGNILKCQNMQLGDFDSSGRRSFYTVENSFEYFEINTVIAAIGEHVDYGLLDQNKFELDKKKEIISDPLTNETNIQNVFIGGDALHGPATVVKAIADARKTADAILRKENILPMEVNLSALPPKKEIIEAAERKKGLMSVNFDQSDSQCLSCNFVCNKCVDVCPNRANVEIKIDNSLFKNRNQILHIDQLCNECGNCETFCPYGGAPYTDKITYFQNEITLSESSNNGFCFLSNNGVFDKILIRMNGKTQEMDLSHASSLENVGDSMQQLFIMIRNIVDGYKFLISVG